MTDRNKFWEGSGRRPTRATAYMRAHSMDVHDGHHLWANLSPDIPDTPECRLAFQIFIENCKDMTRYVRSKKGRGLRMFREAQAWFDNPKVDHPFYYPNVCDFIGIDAEDFRRRLRLWVAKARSETRRRGSTASASTARLELEPARDAA